MLSGVDAMPVRSWDRRKCKQDGPVSRTTQPLRLGRCFRINPVMVDIELRWNEAGDDGINHRASLREIRFINLSGEQFRLDSVDRQFELNELSLSASPSNTQMDSLCARTTMWYSSTVTANVTVAADISRSYIVTLEAPGTLTPLNSGTPVIQEVTRHLQFSYLPFPFLASAQRA